MKSHKIVALLIALSTAVSMLPQVASSQQGSAGFRLFYDELSPYGTWVDYQNYGYVWMPNTDSDFSPYVTSGRWVFTDDGWTWISDYPWGWATFHYGRWDYDDVYGWFWVPDDEWGPAWVSWRRSPGYFGWAPLRPGISVSIAFGGDYHERNERWTFVRDRDFARPDMDHRFIDRGNNTTIINISTVIVNARRDDKRNVTYIAGPDRADVQKATHTTVNLVAIRETDQPGHRLSNGELQIFRPRMQKRNGDGQDPTPAKVARLSDIRPVSERNAGSRRQQPPTVAPPVAVQPSQQRAANPPAGRATEQQPPTVIPSNRSRSPQPLSLDPSRSRGKENQTQNVPRPKKVDQAQSNKKQDEKNKQEEKPKQREQ